MNRKILMIVVAVCSAALLSACGSSTPIGVTLTTVPPPTLEVGLSATIAATVTNDSSNSGVAWTCTPSPCGTFNPAMTASGVTTVYTAPATPGAVMITATSVKNIKESATGSVTIDAVATVASLTGTYTYYANGWDAAGAPYSIVGNVVLDATGDITGGEQDYFDLNTDDIITADPITAATGALTVGATGQGSITITPTTAPVETLSLTVVNNNHVLITEFDALATSAGSFDLQTAPTSIPTGGNALALFDVADDYELGGVVTSDGVSVFTPAGEGDDDFFGTTSLDFTLSGSFTAPDSFGRGTITLQDPNFLDTFTFAYYVVGPEAFRLIAIDNNTFAVGSMYGQGTGTFSAASLTGSYVFAQAGEGGGFGTYSAVGQFTTDATAMFTAGVADVNEGDGAPVAAGSLLADTYSVDASGYGSIALADATTDTLGNFGVYVVDPAINVTDPNNTSGGGGAVMLDLDVDNEGVGVIVPQSSTSLETGNFAVITDGGYVTTATPVDFFDLVGQVFSDGVSNITGTVDYNDLFNLGPVPAAPLVATYTADATNVGRYTLAVTLNNATTPASVVAYAASGSLQFSIDVDSPSAGIGDVNLTDIEQQQ